MVISTGIDASVSQETMFISTLKHLHRNVSVLSFYSLDDTGHE